MRELPSMQMGGYFDEHCWYAGLRCMHEARAADTEAKLPDSCTPFCIRRTLGLSVIVVARTTSVLMHIADQPLRRRRVGKASINLGGLSKAPDAACSPF
jgi:hypothetical protein